VPLDSLPLINLPSEFVSFRSLLGPSAPNYSLPSAVPNPGCGPLQDTQAMPMPHTSVAAILVHAFISRTHFHRSRPFQPRTDPHLFKSSNHCTHLQRCKPMIPPPRPRSLPQTGATALHIAAKNGHLNLIGPLIVMGIDLDARDKDVLSASPLSQPTMPHLCPVPTAHSLSVRGPGALQKRAPQPHFCAAHTHTRRRAFAPTRAVSTPPRQYSNCQPRLARRGLLRCTLPLGTTSSLRCSCS
jgi:hypothetical protein